MMTNIVGQFIWTDIRLRRLLLHKDCPIFEFSFSKESLAVIRDMWHVIRAEHYMICSTKDTTVITDVGV